MFVQGVLEGRRAPSPFNGAMDRITDARERPGSSEEH